MHFSLVLSLLGLVMNSLSSAIPADILSHNFSISRNAAEDFLINQYGHAFIEMTPANVEASGVRNWYSNWTQVARANDSLYTKYGEVNYFGMTFLQDEDYQCGFGFNGCNRRPTWLELMNMYPEDLELARRVYFAAKMQNMVNLVLKVIYVSNHRVRHEYKFISAFGHGQDYSDEQIGRNASRSGLN